MRAFTPARPLLRGVLAAALLLAARPAPAAPGRGVPLSLPHDRYSRQTVFAEIGEGGQERLRRARVVVAGCGALGSVAAEMLARAVEHYKAVLAIWTPERRPLFWSATISNVGSALRLLGELRNEPRALEQAIAAYKAALSVRTRARTPRAWGITQTTSAPRCRRSANRRTIS